MLNDHAGPGLAPAVVGVLRQPERVAPGQQLLRQQMEGGFGGAVAGRVLEVGEVMLAYRALLGDQSLAAARTGAPAGQSAGDIRDELQHALPEPIARM